MGNLIVSTVAALAMAITVYNNSASFLLAFLAYSATGTLALISLLVADAMSHWREDRQFRTTE